MLNFNQPELDRSHVTPATKAMLERMDACDAAGAAAQYEAAYNALTRIETQSDVCEQPAKPWSSSRSRMTFETRAHFYGWEAT